MGARVRSVGPRNCASALWANAIVCIRTDALRLPSRRDVVRHDSDPNVERGMRFGFFCLTMSGRKVISPARTEPLSFFSHPHLIVGRRDHHRAVRTVCRRQLRQRARREGPKPLRLDGFWLSTYTVAGEILMIKGLCQWSGELRAFRSSAPQTRFWH